MPLPEVHLVAGTADEAVRLAPVATALTGAGLLTPILLAAGPDPATLTPVFAAFGLSPDITLTTGGTTGTIRELDELWAVRTPAAVLVAGDGPTGLAAALAACWRRVPVVHLGAGRRGGELDPPHPREADRRLIAQVTSLHLAPTPAAAMNLLDEHVPAGDVLVTGSTAVDAALAVTGRVPGGPAAPAAATGRRLLVVAVHHVAPPGEPLDRILAAVRVLVARYPDVDVVLPGHRDPAVRSRIAAALGDAGRVTGPLSHPGLCRLLSGAYLLLTDSAGVEAAPAFGVPVLMLRDVPERVEALHAGCARLVGTDTGRIVGEAAALLDSPVRRDAVTAGGNPYGDGRAARRAAQATAALLGLTVAPEPMPVPAGLEFGARA